MTIRKFASVSVSLCMLMIPILSIQVPSAHASDEFDSLRLRYVEDITGGNSYDPSDPVFKSLISEIDLTACAYWSSLNKEAGRTYLWSEFTYGSDTRSNDIYTGKSVYHLVSMALAYRTKGSMLENNVGLKNDIIAAMEWIYTYKYNEDSPTYAQEGGHGWYKEIGTPKRLNALIALLYDDFTSTQKTHYLNAIDHFLPDPAIWVGKESTGANRADTCAIVVVRGILGKSSTKIWQGQAAMEPLFNNVTSGDGFYADGSFIQHGKYAYTGGYGGVQLQQAIDLLYLLYGSTWEITDPDIENVYKWVFDAFEPLIHKSFMFDDIRGRAVARYTSDAIDSPSDVNELIRNVLKLAQITSPHQPRLKSLAKDLLQYASTFDSKSNIQAITKARDIVDDTSIVPRGDLSIYKQYPAMDVAVQQRPEYGVEISMHSNRTYNYEITNGENLRGWHQGDGWLQLADADYDAYRDAYYQTINSYRMPGTTVNQNTTYASGKTSNKSWVGGTDIDGLYGTTGMELHPNGQTLTAKKSWFIFDDEVVSLGSGITSSDNKVVETIVENKLINSAGSNVLHVNGATKTDTLGWSETMSNVNWAHLDSNTTGAGTGYYFPEGTTVKGLRQARTGSSYDISHEVGVPQNDSFTRNYLTLWFDHGSNPSNASYAYVLLPNKSSTDVGIYTTNPDVSILANTTSVQAVKENTLGITAANFWTDTSSTTGIVTSNKKASVMVQETGTELSLSVSDPTQINTGTIEIEIDKPSSGIISLDPQVTVTQLSPKIKMSVQVNGMRGGAIKAKFDMTPVPVNPGTEMLVAVADAYVRGGASANTNFGADSGLHIKTSSEAYTRYSYVKFDLSHVNIPVGSAKVKLVPTIVGDPGITNTAALVNDDTWSETALTWNNRPANGTDLASWTGMTVGTPVEFDVTAQVNAALAGDKTVSMVVYAPSDTGDLGFVSYGSREDAVAGNRPSLVIEPPESILLAPSDDAYVRGGADASTSFGSASDLAVKNDSAAYTRYSYLQFDLAGLNAPVAKAELRLVPNIVGSSANTNTAALVNDNTWSESTLTWNNNPTIGTDLVRWTNIVPYNPVLMDVTAQVNAALARDQKLSVAIYSPTNIGGLGFVSYFSSEDTNSAHHPSLVVTP